MANRPWPSSLNQPCILENVFCHLNSADLANVGAVCNAWRGTAEGRTTKAGWMKAKKEYQTQLLGNKAKAEEMAQSWQVPSPGTLLASKGLPQVIANYLIPKTNRPVGPDPFADIADVIGDWGDDLEDVPDTQASTTSQGCVQLQGTPEAELPGEKFVGLKSHPLYLPAQTRMKGASDHPACVLLAMLTLCNDDKDVKGLLRCLLTSPNCSNSEALDLFYRMAVIFYVLRLAPASSLPLRAHFNLHHALAVEELSLEPSPLQDEMTGVRWTPEQAKIINMEIDPSDPRVTKVMAFAGSGKTSTLVELCRRNPYLKFLVIVFNASIKTQWDELKLDNVKPYTAHGLATNYWKNHSGMRDVPLGRNFWIRDDVIEYPKWSADGKAKFDGRKKRKFRAQVRNTIESFCQSTEASLGYEHTPTKWPDSSRHDNVRRSASLGLPPPALTDVGMAIVTPEERLQILPEAQRLWRAIKDRRLNIVWGCPIYLKMFQLKEPDLKSILDRFGPEVLLIDEAQDMNPAMLDICMKQKMPKVIVGDPHQQIYEFNGAVNGFQEVDKFVQTRQTFRLTQSFRFGFEVAFAATAVLQVMKNELMPVIGNPARDSNIDGDEDKEGVTAIIARTNASVCSEIMAFLEAGPREGIVPTVASSSFDWLTSTDLTTLIDIKNGHGGTGKLRGCHDLEEAAKYARDTFDLELSTKVQLVKEHGSKLLVVISKVMELFMHKGNLRPISDPKVNLIFTTVHGIKGEQVDNVRLVNDFHFDDSLVDHQKLQSEYNCRLPEEEINLLYVALTRAKKCIRVNCALAGILSSPRVGFSFGRRIETGQDWHCDKCDLMSDMSVDGRPVRTSTYRTCVYKLCLDCVMPCEVNLRVLGRTEMFNYAPPLFDNQCEMIDSLIGPRKDYLDENVQKLVKEKGVWMLPLWGFVPQVNNEAESLLQDAAVMEALSRDFSDDEQVFDEAVSQEFNQDF